MNLKKPNILFEKMSFNESKLNAKRTSEIIFQTSKDAQQKISNVHSSIVYMLWNKM